MDTDDIPQEVLDAYREKRSEWGLLDRAREKVAFAFLWVGLKVVPIDKDDMKEVATKSLLGSLPTSLGGGSNAPSSNSVGLDITEDVPSFSGTLGEDAVEVDVEVDDEEGDGDG